MWVSAKFGTGTVVSVIGTLVEEKMCRFKGKCPHFSFNKCPIYTHDGASAEFRTNSHEMDKSVFLKGGEVCFYSHILLCEPIDLKYVIANRDENL